MDATAERMEAQLKLWGRRIDKLAAKTQRAGAQAGFDALIYVDELKGLHAIAQSKLDEFRAAGDTDRARLEAEMKSAWKELNAALKNPRQ